MSDFTPTLSRSSPNGHPELSNLSEVMAVSFVESRASQKSLEMMRPTLVLCGGGTGQRIATHLKAMLISRFPATWDQKIHILAVDTSEEAVTVPVGDKLVQLESGSELIYIGNVPVSNIRRNLKEQAAIRERLGVVMANLPGVVLRAGAKQLRPLGLLALLWNFSKVNDAISRAIWSLAGREQMEANLLHQQQGINVFLCGSFVGGTGSGTLFDLAHMVRERFRELGTQADFCHITGIGVLPQAFRGISGPNLLPNTAAALHELNHLMVKGGFRARYPDGQLIESQEAPFNLFYVIDGVDEQGQTWANLNDVTAMVAEGIFLQMGSQLGRKGENAFDNLDESVAQVTESGQGTFLSSFGVGYLEFDAPAAAALCTRWLLLDLIQEGWLKAHETEFLDNHLNRLLTPLQANRLAPRLLHDPQSETAFQIDLAVPGYLQRQRPEEIAINAPRYIADYSQARLHETFLPQINRNAAALTQEQQSIWQEWFYKHLFAPVLGLPQLDKALRYAQTQMADWLAAARRQQQALGLQMGRLQEAQQQAGRALVAASQSFFVGRNGRVQNALAHFFQSSRQLFQAQLEHHLLQTQVSLWQDLMTTLRGFVEQVRSLDERLQQVRSRLHQELPNQLRRLTAGGIARLSLADEAYLRQLYLAYPLTWADVPQQLGDAAVLQSQSSELLTQSLLNRLRPHFDPVAALTLEQVLQQRSGEMTPAARRQQLFRLATPSWNIDRTRLPEGGEGLTRLEVLGVCDESDTLFKDEQMRVSTYDPHRLMALVVVAGAPQSALQQYSLYQRLLEQPGGRKPIYVLPNFITGDTEGQLAFALGNWFNFIRNQGTFFYYHPEDTLSAPVQLANGLGNAIQLFVARDDLVKETMGRVENHIAQMGLREAIASLTEYVNKETTGSTRLDEQLRELRRLVRDYVENLRQIDALSQTGRGRSSRQE